MSMKDFENLTNDAGETIDAPGDTACELGTICDAAFLRGRQYRRKNYSLTAAKQVVRERNPLYRKNFENGWHFQNRYGH